MGKYRLEIKKSAVKEIEHLPRKDLEAVLDKISSLAENPRPHNWKKLSGQEMYRVRCGDYLILYSIEEDILTIYIVKVGPRRDVYRYRWGKEARSILCQVRSQVAQGASEWISSIIQRAMSG